MLLVLCCRMRVDLKGELSRRARERVSRLSCRHDGHSHAISWRLEVFWSTSNGFALLLLSVLCSCMCRFTLSPFTSLLVTSHHAMSVAPVALYVVDMGADSDLSLYVDPTSFAAVVQAVRGGGVGD